MTPEKALELLDRAVAQLNAPRQAHIQLQQAVECLSILIAGRAASSGPSKDPSDNDHN